LIENSSTAIRHRLPTCGTRFNRASDRTPKTLLLARRFNQKTKIENQK
jgi:hypothetical protein